MHIRETGTRGEVLAAQRMFGEEVDMVVDHHEVTDLERWIHTACRIADKERLDAQLVHHPLGECHVLHRVALIVMETTVHRHDVFAAKLAEDKFSGMTLNGRDGKIRNIFIGKLSSVSYL